jgi:hypothetical protein
MDLNLSETERELVSQFEKLLLRECPLTVVRAAEAEGHDAKLWTQLVSFGVPRLAVPSQGERASTYSELALLAELCGNYLVPGPVLESLAAIRALGSNEEELAASEQSLGSEPYQAILEGRRLISLAFWGIDGHPQQLIPAGGIVDCVVCCLGGKAVVAEPTRSHRYANCHGGTPLAKWHIESGAASAPLGGSFENVLASWRLFASAALVGIAGRAIKIGSAYAKERRAFGTPIGTFQGVAHPLADSATGVAGARLLARKAAWAMDQGRGVESERLTRLAYAFAAETATVATTRCVHLHGGYGSAIDYDIQLYHQRARVLATVSGDPRDGFEKVGQTLIGARGGAS